MISVSPNVKSDLICDCRLTDCCFGQRLSGASTYQGHTFQLCCRWALGTRRMHLFWTMAFWGQHLPRPHLPTLLPLSTRNMKNIFVIWLEISKKTVICQVLCTRPPSSFLCIKFLQQILCVCAWLLSQARLWEPSNRMLGRNTWPLSVRAAPG